MSQTLLGETFDIHGGGLDLKFPHHECEIAQSEAVSGKSLAKIWMHNGFITVNEEKMSKSLGNFFLLKNIFNTSGGNYDPLVVRLFILSTHYRSPIEFKFDLLDQAERNRDTLRNFLFLNKNEPEGEVDKIMIDKIKLKLSDDFDTPGAITEIFEWMKSKPSHPKKTLMELNKIFNIFNEIDWDIYNYPSNVIDLKLNAEEAKKRKDYKTVDGIKTQLGVIGYESRDSKDGTIQLFPTSKVILKFGKL